MDWSPFDLPLTDLRHPFHIHHMEIALAEAETAEDRLTLARAAGFDVSANDVGAVNGALGISELADDDLERVTGGSAITLVDNTSSDVPFIIFQSAASI